MRRGAQLHRDQPIEEYARAEKSREGCPAVRIAWLCGDGIEAEFVADTSDQKL